MENVHYDLAESLYAGEAGIADGIYASQQLNFSLLANFPGGDEDEDDEEENGGQSSDENDPPLDDGVVHSPVTPQTGGKPK